MIKLMSHYLSIKKKSIRLLNHKPIIYYVKIYVWLATEKNNYHLCIECKNFMNQLE